MTDMSDYTEDAVLNKTLRNTDFTTVAAAYVSLHTTATTDAGGGTEISTSGTGYARQACTFAAPSGGASTTSADITFSAALTAWGTVTHAALWDASTSGNMLYHTALSASKVVAIGDVFKFLTGDLTVTLD